MPLDRRRFLNSVLVSVAGMGTNSLWLGNGQRRWEIPSNLETMQDPIRDITGSHVRIGLAAYSFRKHFDFFKGKTQNPQDGRPIDMFGFIDYCAQLRCGGELTSYFFPPDIDKRYLLRIKRHAFLRGVPIVGTAIGNNFTVGRGEILNRQIADAKRWIDRAAMMGAPHIRFFAGTRKQLEAAPDNMKIAIEALQQCVDHAAQFGIFVGVENHGQLTASQVLEIVNGVESKWFGINLDTGNFVSDDPYRDLEMCAPFAVNVQLKVKMKDLSGKRIDVDFQRIGKILNKANYRGFLVLEYEEEDPFKQVPDLVGRLLEQY